MMRSIHSLVALAVLLVAGCSTFEPQSDAPTLSKEALLGRWERIEATEVGVLGILEVSIATMTIAMPRSIELREDGSCTIVIGEQEIAGVFVILPSKQVIGCGRGRVFLLGAQIMDGDTLLLYAETDFPTGFFYKRVK